MVHLNICLSKNKLKLTSSLKCFDFKNTSFFAEKKCSAKKLCRLSLPDTHNVALITMFSKMEINPDGYDLFQASLLQFGDAG